MRMQMPHKGISAASVLALMALTVLADSASNGLADAPDFLRTKGRSIVDSKGAKFQIRGTNLGNWLNPEGYMFGFSKCSSPHFIDEMFRQLVGPEETRKFWKAFKDNYITEADIAFVAATGSNTVRLPFHYRLFTDEDYLDLSGHGDGFKRIDDCIGWCRKYKLRLILDMHDCPGGQTGSNIDDSYGNAWLFESEGLLRQFCDIWRIIARRYANEPVVLGYDLMNEPISHELKEKELYNSRIEAILKAAVSAIREVDRNHIVILAGAQWNSNFKPFKDFSFDSNMIYQCHHYDFRNPKLEEWKVSRFAEFSAKSGHPMYMGEWGHNEIPWYRDMVAAMEKHDIGWTMWPLKKPGNSCWFGFRYPDGWKDTIVAFAESDRSSYKKIYAARPDRARAVRLMHEYTENCKAEHCVADREYLEACGMKVPEAGVSSAGAGSKKGQDPSI